MAGLRFIIAGCIGLWAMSAHAAFDLSPIIVTMAPSGPGATGSITLINSDDNKTPVQVGIYRREPDQNGKEKYEDNKDNGELFQIFPTQVILNPKEKRTVRITYVGDPKVARELSFRIIAEEFPINVSDPKRVKNKAVASIAIATKYVGSLYVTPNGAKSDLQIEASLEKNKNANEMVLMMENKGTEHVILKNPKFKIFANSKEYPMPTELAAQIGTNNILAGKVRKFTIPWPSNVPPGPVKVSVEVAKK